ncbi:MAG: SDR family NAD(P)-dependent oxidoreductase [Pyrinomonadaceae bacterium]
MNSTPRSDLPAYLKNGSLCMIWKGKVVFLTGASSGIGEGLAVAMAKRGAVLGLLARRENLLREIAEKCESAGGTARIFAYDVTDAEAVRKAGDKLRQEFGHVDILIANAGIGGNDPETRSFEPKAVKKVLDVNLMGAVNAVSAVLPEMLERGRGQLVAISSLAGFRGLPKSAAYSASKAGMTAFFESVRLDVQQHGIDITIIQPGFIKTSLTSGRNNKMPFLMELDDAIPHFLKAIERKKKFAAFPWQLAAIVRAGRFLPARLYDRIASRATFRV